MIAELGENVVTEFSAWKAAPHYIINTCIVTTQMTNASEQCNNVPNGI